MMERLVSDTAGGVTAGAVSARFHNTLVEAIAETCRRIRGETGLDRVCLSGGTFQNMRLLSTVTPALRTAGFEVVLHAKVPPNDGGIALGQAAIAAELLK
jgi:hydrogenase maturation protein HypF